MSISLEPIDLVEIAESYGRKWIGLAFDMRKVYASGNSPEEVEEELAKNGISLDGVIITKAPRPDTCLAI